ncbi:MAG: cell division protein FtsB [Betaproteobacteria bacterium]|nr:cell division protein FtsB [Betaproteobacteria bacterium]
MRFLTLALVGVIVLLQNPLWFGKGGWLKVLELERQVAAQKHDNVGLRQRNAALDAEVRDLKEGYDAIEERARSELSMIRRDEIFFQVLEPPNHLAAASGEPNH